MRFVFYALLRRTLSQDMRNRMKEAFRKSRKGLSPIRRLLHGHFGCQDLIDHLHDRLPGNTEVLMVHSSMHDLYPMFSGSPEELIEALIEYCADRKTLCMPAFVFGGKEYLFTATVNDAGEITVAKSSTIAQDMIRRYEDGEVIRLKPVGN